MNQRLEEDQATAIPLEGDAMWLPLWTPLAPEADADVETTRAIAALNRSNAWKASIEINVQVVSRPDFTSFMREYDLLNAKVRAAKRKLEKELGLEEGEIKTTPTDELIDAVSKANRKLLLLGVRGCRGRPEIDSVEALFSAGLVGDAIGVVMAFQKPTPRQRSLLQSARRDRAGGA